MTTTRPVTAASHITSNHGTGQVVLAALAGWAPLIALALMLLAAGRAVRRWQLERRWEACDFGSRPVVIIPPPGPARDGAQLLWSKLAQIVFEDLPVTWQYHWTGGCLEITAWVPWTVSDDTIRQLIGEAWPGALAFCFLPDEIPDGTVQVRGGTVRPPRPRNRDDPARPAPDTIGALCGAAESLGAGESAVVQILARPQAVAWSRFRPGKVRRARCTCPSAEGCRRHSDARGRPDDGPGAQPVWWNTTIQFLTMAATRPFATPSWEAIRMESQNFGEGARLHWLWVNMAAAVTGKLRRRLSSLDPLADVNTRWFRRGRLLSVPEIAGLATLPPDPVLPG